MKKDLICVKDFSCGEIEELFKLTDRLKKEKSKFNKRLYGKTLALVFQKPSNRTRVSFEVGMFELGGYSVYLGPGEINLGVRESIEDVSKTLSRYVDGIVLRTYEHKNIVRMAKSADISVINGLSDLLHPCQALADVYTVREKLRKLKGVTLCYVGDGNNVCNSLLFACAICGLNINVASPRGYAPNRQVFQESLVIASRNKARINLFNNPEDAARGADVLYTDVWASMGQEKEAALRRKIFRPYQINNGLLKLANKKALVMHCLPAHRGDEITDEVMDSKNSVIFDQAENRMHVQKAILIRLLGAKK
ncbi:MAG: ornithine carbamoyltransferase [Candidatus Omnitrophica bacterium]|nr:ornithine carbamoyltransferase [Candidatus Omnitrophota bacterium]